MKSFERHVFTKEHKAEGEWKAMRCTDPGGYIYRWPTKEQAGDFYLAPEYDRRHYKVVEVNEPPNIEVSGGPV